MEIIQSIEAGIRIFIHEKHAAASRRYFQKKLDQIADSKFKCQLEVFYDNGDAEKLITNLVNVIKF